MAPGRVEASVLQIIIIPENANNTFSFNALGMRIFKLTI